MGKRGPKRRNNPPPGEIGPLISRNVVIEGRRTSMRLEPSMWEALEEIAVRERMTVSDVCSAIHQRIAARAAAAAVAVNPAEVTLTAAVRAFMISYYRNASTDDGHRMARHGAGTPFVGTPFDQGPSAGGDGASDEVDGGDGSLKRLAMEETGSPAA